MSETRGGIAIGWGRRQNPHPHTLPFPPCALLLSRRPSGIPEKDLRSVTVPCLLRQRDALQRRLQRQEAENRQLADAVLAGRRQVQELQLQGQARWQTWQVGVLALPSGTVPCCSRGDNRPRENKCLAQGACCSVSAWVTPCSPAGCSVSRSFTTHAVGWPLGLPPKNILRATRVLSGWTEVLKVAKVTWPSW